MNRLSTQERARILACLVEGNSIRATCRMTGAAKGTGHQAAGRCWRSLQAVPRSARVHDRNQARSMRRNLVVLLSQGQNFPADMRGVFGIGDVWTWTALDADT